MNLKILQEKANLNIANILKHSLKYDHSSLGSVLVIYDTNYQLTNILTEAYKFNLLTEDKKNDRIKFLDFDTFNSSRDSSDCGKQENFEGFENLSENKKDAALREFDKLSKGDLVILIQSSNFRIDDFRIRLHLFSKGLKVIEHMHLHRNAPESFGTYINSLAYGEVERAWYTSMWSKLNSLVSRSTSLTLKSQNNELNVGELEIPKPNIGCYDGFTNIGGTFPIGEVFTEAKILEDLNGSVMIYGFANRDFNLSFHKPFQIDIVNGLIVGYSQDAPNEFVEVLELVKTFERPIIREIGFGLNKAITKENSLGDITAFERIYGMHISLGEKHSVYKKPGITTHKTKFHVDLFLDVQEAVFTDKNKQVEIISFI
jgi:aminopeptidase